MQNGEIRCATNVDPATGAAVGSLPKGRAFGIWRRHVATVALATLAFIESYRP